MNANNNSIKVKLNVDNELFLSLYRIADYFRRFFIFAYFHGQA
jgi:hypothetical protein